MFVFILLFFNINVINVYFFMDYRVQTYARSG